MRRDVKYIQLPPLPEDIDVEALEPIWLIAKMNPEERADALTQLEAMLGDEETGEMDCEVMQEILDKYGNEEKDEVFSQYIESIRSLIAKLILESYDIAAFVYQKRCVEKMSIEDIMKISRLSEDALKMFVKYYDIRHDVKNKI